MTSASADMGFGKNVIFAPMLDLSRDLRWGRIVEGPGEDPYRGAKMGEAIIKGFQGDGEKIKIAACAKHYIWYFSVWQTESFR